ncbi:MAG TPA: PAS domain S-box protein [Ramlibacter sp.]|nr:PAS domain S-box protein [Ramlibacter sp.]
MSLSIPGSSAVHPAGLPDMGGLCRAIVEQAQDAIVFADREGVIRLWNRGAEIIFGFSAAEAVGQGLEIIVPEKFRQAHHEGFRKAVASGVTRYDGRVLTTRATNKFGSRLYVDMSFTLLKDATGSVSGVFAIARDGTARHQEEVARRVGQIQPA